MTRNRWTAAAIGLVAGVVVVLVVVLTRGGDGAPSAAATAKPSATPTTLSPGSEIAPVQSPSPGSDGSAPATGQPDVTVSEQPLVPDPPAQAASATGTLVAGYPSRVMAPVPGSTVRSSSVSPSPGRLQAALDASANAGSDDILRFYAVRLAPLGFVGTPAPAVGGSVATSYERGASTVVVTVVATGSGPRSYTVFANLRTKKT